MSSLLRAELDRISHRICWLDWMIDALRSQVTDADIQVLRDRFRNEPDLGAVLRPGSSLSTSWLAEDLFDSKERLIAKLVSRRMERVQLRARQKEIRRLLSQGRR